MATHRAGSGETIGESDFPKQSPFHAAAQRMFELEHTRWNHHTLIFLTIIGALLVGAAKETPLVAPQLALPFAAFCSFMWLCAIQNNRASSAAWAKTIRYIEAHPTCTTPFKVFAKYRRSFKMSHDYWENFGIAPLGTQWPIQFRRPLCLSALTRVYATIATALTIFFIVLEVYFLVANLR